MKKHILKAFILILLAGVFSPSISSFADDDIKKVAKAVALINVTPVQSMQLIKVGKVTRLVSEDRFELDDGRIYILSNIRVPLKWQTPVKKYFQDKLIGKSVGIFIPKDNTMSEVSDKFGQTTAHVMTATGLWVQADLISKGLAYADSTATDREMVRTLYLYEEAARKNSFGIWAIPDYNIKNSTTIGKHLNSFQVYRGRVDIVKRGQSKRVPMTILFSSNEKDLKVQIWPHLLEKLEKPWTKNFELNNLPGYEIRVRGWVEDSKGPSIKLTHLEQIEILDGQYRK